MWFPIHADGELVSVTVEKDKVTYIFYDNDKYVDFKIEVL